MAAALVAVVDEEEVEEEQNEWFGSMILSMGLSFFFLLMKILGDLKKKKTREKIMFDKDIIPSDLFK